jgi:hypothetical protein
LNILLLQVVERAVHQTHIRKVVAAAALADIEQQQV